MNGAAELERFLDRAAQRRASRARTNGAAADHETAAAMDDGRGTVIFRPGHRTEVLDALREALAANAEKLSIFVYGGALAKPYLADAEGFDGAKVAVLEINRVSARSLAEALSRCVTFHRARTTRGGEQRVAEADIPVGLAQFILDGPDRWSGIPIISRFTEGPMWIGGQLHARSGYHRAARAWLTCPPGVALHAPLTRDTAVAALNRTREWLSEFPFASPADESAAVSLLMLAALRGSLPTAPGYVIDAPEFGSGKSTLTKLASIVQCGRPPAVATLPRHDAEELRKVIDAAQLAGRTAIVLDNVVKLVEADALAHLLLTEPERQVRVLGSSHVVRVPCGQLVIINGVNVRVGDDLVRRLVTDSARSPARRPELADIPTADAARRCGPRPGADAQRPFHGPRGLPVERRPCRGARAGGLRRIREDLRRTAHLAWTARPAGQHGSPARGRSGQERAARSSRPLVGRVGRSACDGGRPVVRAHFRRPRGRAPRD